MFVFYSIFLNNIKYRLIVSYRYFYCMYVKHFTAWKVYMVCSATGFRKFKGWLLTSKIKKKIALSALFFSYRQLKIGQYILAGEQAFLCGRKVVSLSSGAHSDSQFERYMGCSLARTNRGREEMVDWTLNQLTRENP